MWQGNKEGDLKKLLGKSWGKKFRVVTHYQQTASAKIGGNQKGETGSMEKETQLQRRSRNEGLMVTLMGHVDSMPKD